MTWYVVFCGKETDIVDGIRKYSKEWFTLNGGTSDAQLNSVEGLKQGIGKTNSRGKAIDKSIFTGTQDEVNQKIENLTKNMHGAPSATFLNIKSYGAENIFNALDADGDGTVTEEEIQDVAALSTKEFSDKDDTFFSTDDLDILYNNALDAVNSSFVNMGNTTEFNYENGDKTRVSLGNDGKISSKYVLEQSEDGAKEGVLYDYSTKSTTKTSYDNQGRVTKIDKDADGKENDFIKTFEYGEDGSKTITKTDFIGTETRVYGSDGKLQSKENQYNYESDGEIGVTRQKNIGDCWVLSGVNALNNSEFGRAMLKNAIHQNDDGSVTVTLKGVGKEYTYSAKEIIQNQYNSPELKYSSGDTDMNLFEKAIGDYRKELIESGDYTANGRNLSRTAGDKATIDDPLKGGQIDEAIYYITGLTSEYSENDIDAARNMIDTYQNSRGKYTMNCTFQEKDENIKEGTITTGHAYSISKVDDDYVYVVNPWNSSFEIPYPKEDFLNNTKQISLTDLTPGMSETSISAPRNDVEYTPITPKKSFGSKILDFFKNLFR